MNSRTSHSLSVMMIAFVLSCASAPKAGAPADTDLSGSWVLNASLSELPTMPSAQNRGGGEGRGGGRGGGGGGGRGGGGGQGGRGGGGRAGGMPQQNPAAMAELQGYLGSTDRIVLSQGNESVKLALTDGTTIDVATDKEKHALSETRSVKAWWDDLLILEQEFGSIQITERYEHLVTSDRLLVTVKIEGRSEEFRRVYERTQGPGDTR